MRNHLFKLAAASSLGVLSLFISSCNLTGDIDDPQSREEIMQDAKSKIENEQCDEAVTMLNNLPTKDDESKKLQGWGLLCLAGATVENVSRTLLTYDSSSNNLTIVGKLANALLPTDAVKQAKVDSAIAVFNSMIDQNESKLNRSIAEVVKAATILARQSRDGIRVGKAEMVSSVSGCVGSCGGAAGNGACAAGLSAGDTTDVTTALSNASTLISGLTQFGSILTLVQQLGAGAAGNNVTRCFVANSLMEN